MKIIGEEMHAMNKTFIKAMEEQNAETLIDMARGQVDAGAMALDINLGQVRRFGLIISWLVETIQQAVDVPLLLSNNVLSQQRALEVHKGRPTINAVTADAEGLWP